MEQPILELRNITKTFGPKVANNDISLKIYSGRVHAIVGENGAGKSTLMNMISGNLLPDSGSILVDGIEQHITTPNKADALGIGMVHQHFKLVPSLTVAANIFLGKEPRNKFGKLDQRAMERKVTELA
ncbi:MAG: ATP-binding cassette domain-containing protein, partial [Aurantimicrobium sp.]